MSNDKIYHEAIPSEETLRIYDEICGAMFVNLYTLSKNSETIDLAFFDPKNEEHLFLLGVARGVGDAFGKKVRVAVSPFQLWKLNRGIEKDSRLQRFDPADGGIAISTEVVLDFMREQAQITSGDHSIFYTIYRTYYARKKAK